jgi:hypothetical protein
MRCVGRWNGCRRDHEQTLSLLLNSSSDCRAGTGARDSGVLSRLWENRCDRNRLGSSRRTIVRRRRLLKKQACGVY